MRPNLSNILKVLGIPTGGTAGQVLKKTGSGDTDYGWANESGGGGREVPTGGSLGSILTKSGSGDNSYYWADPLNLTIEVRNTLNLTIGAQTNLLLSDMSFYRRFTYSHTQIVTDIYNLLNDAFGHSCNLNFMFSDINIGIYNYKNLLVHVDYCYFLGNTDDLYFGFIVSKYNNASTYHFDPFYVHMKISKEWQRIYFWPSYMTLVY